MGRHTRFTFRSGLLCLLVLANSNVPAQLPGLDNPVPVGPYLNGVFPAVKPGASDWSSENAFTNLVFTDPIWLASYPGTNELVLLGKQGVLWRFQNRPDITQAEVVQMLDWRSFTQVSEDQGMYSFVFHPEFGRPASTNRNFVYICYSHRPNLPNAGPDRTYWRVSRFTAIEGSRIVDVNSERVLINQYDPHSWHQGGAMFFDDEGYLYVSNGDGGAAQGSLGLTQKIDFGLYSGVFRIDVDKIPARSHPIRRQPQSHSSLPGGWPASFTQDYFIPDSNPFQNANGALLEEYFALGLRSPHSMQYDSASGQIWLGDVGDAAREEIDLVTKGANLQWNFREGFATGFSTMPGNLIGSTTPPVLDWSRADARTVICGHIYRGTKFTDALGGKLIVGDFYFGKIWALAYQTNLSPTLELLIDDFPNNPGAKLGLANICRDAAGEEVYFMTLNGTDIPGGTIRKLVRSAVAPEPPALLSQTGAFTNLQTLAPMPGLVPYTVNSPLWSDRADKGRWIALPNDGTHNTASERISFNETNNWVFPAGTVFVKHFELPSDERNPTQTVRLETRFIVCITSGDKYGITYRWLPDQSDALLLPGGASGSYSVTNLGGATRLQTWSFPSRGDCLFCHNSAAGQALGLKTYQLNGDAHYPQTGRTANQLKTWNALGMFSPSLTNAQIDNFMASRSLDDTTAPLEHRVRSYLDSNCSHCHRPGGPGIGFDARLVTALRSQGIVNGPVQQFLTLGADAHYIRPGVLNKSAIHYQMLGANGSGMPPLAKNLVDSNAVALLTAYILGLNSAEFEVTSSVSARYIRFMALQEIEGGPWAAAAEFEVLDPNLVRMLVTAVAADSQEVSNYAATNAVDGSTETFWHTQYQAATPGYPHWLQLDFGSVKPLGGYRYVPRQGSLTGGENNGRVDDWQIEVSTNGSNWVVVHSVTNYGNTIAGYTYSGWASGRPVRASLAGPAVATTNFEATLTFDNDVTGLSASDFNITNATITNLRGSRHYYVLGVQPTGAVVQTSLKTNAVTDAQGFSNLATTILTVLVVENTPYSLWAATNGLFGPDADKLANPDGDALPNAAEYAFGLSPLVFDNAQAQPNRPYALLIQKPNGSFALRIVFQRRIQAAADNLEYAAQFASVIPANGQPVWTEGGATVQVTPLDAEWEQVVVEDSATTYTAATRFARVIARLISP